MINELTASLNMIVTQTQNNLKILGVILLIPWSIFFISHFISNKILLLGIIPRHILGLPGILLAPLLHAN
ncbi:TPA: rhomboid family intramembrane serine protease, partial [Legionella pneumophila subsp. pneumophila]|nr:rhomboid family intramembrane serine protease [Legionella pneumophila subsp. pneumophila]